MLKNLAEKLADQVLNDENPLIAFALTYDVRTELQKRGAFGEIGYTSRKGQDVTISRPALRTLRYRVNHGRGDITQNEWKPNSIMPSMESISI